MGKYKFNEINQLTKRARISNTLLSVTIVKLEDYI